MDHNRFPRSVMIFYPEIIFYFKRHKIFSMKENISFQDYEAYTAEDFETWAILSKRQHKLHHGKISQEYIRGFNKLHLDENRIVKIEALSERMTELAGWTLTPVNGLIPTKDFFYMLVNRQYPVTVSIRKPWEIDFSEQPDIFHDIFGHLPLLLNEKFNRFITRYSEVALNYAENERVVEFLGRLYWYTYEMGLIIEDGDCKPYGSAIITSAREIENSEQEHIPKYPFTLDQVFHTPYNPFDLQKEYFVINSFNELFESLTNLEEKIMEHLLITDEAWRRETAKMESI